MKQNKILGCCYGAAYGDSLGAVTESCLRSEILQAFPNECLDYAESISRLTEGIFPGQVTDDFGSSLYFIKAILRHDGKFNRGIAVEAILDWSQDEIVFGRYAGQNSKNAIERLRQGIIIEKESVRSHFARRNTNGGAMKVSPVALLAKTLDEAVDYALDLCWPTHYNSAAAAGAAAIACAVWQAQQTASTMDSLIEAGIYGARTARMRLEKEGMTAQGPYVDRKIKDAVETIKEAADYPSLVVCLNESIGMKSIVQESVPAVFAIIAACHGDFKQSIRCAVNAGGDTDTVASMIGAILGSRYGLTVIDEKTILRIQEANEFLKLKETIEAYTNLIMKRGY